MYMYMCMNIYMHHADLQWSVYVRAYMGIVALVVVRAAVAAAEAKRRGRRCTKCCWQMGRW